MTHYCKCGWYTESAKERLQHFMDNLDHYAVNKTQWLKIVGPRLNGEDPYRQILP